MMTRNLRALRELKGMHQTDVADRLGISLHSYSNKETGKREFTLEEAKKISELFGLPVDDIFFKQIDLRTNMT